VPENTETAEVWATVELMGHAETAGRISRPADWGGLLRVDVPLDADGAFRTEYFGLAAIYSIKIVSEEIARAYARPQRGMIAYDAPIITRDQYESAVRQMNMKNNQLVHENDELRRRLTSVNALPAPADDEEEN
jgi:hypothetical protein